ncbi:DASH family cryptochrome [Leeuwenhoekiella sp. CH_XMU1409-2]|uniref:DASH family cryptochrome n=1 Tax=Leeuwenhoekiella sp. CH_XMU1409-2 TaxID=3107768 RepID=UPI00300A33A9
MNNLVWFRNDLRVKDNTSLFKASKNAKRLAAIYCFDPRQFQEDQFGFKKTERFRAQFLIETVTELREHLAELNIPLYIYNEQPEDILPQLMERLQIDQLFFQEEWTSEEQEVTRKVKESCSASVTFFESYDQFLIHPEDLPYKSIEAIPNVFTQWRKKCEKNLNIREEVAIAAFPQTNYEATSTSIPTLQDLNLESFEPDHRTAFPFKGGEQQALNRIEDYFWQTKKLAVYKKTRNGLTGKNYSSKLSAWLANGSISARTIYWKIKAFEQEETKNESTYWLFFELMWRDFFKYISLKYGDQIFKIGGILEKDYDWKTNKAAKKEWINGQTKYDFVNANMKEIAATGWMSNRGRQNVASYWAKELQQDWRIGAAYFESMLIDYDVHSNYGNWMYNSGVGNDPRDRKFNIKSQAERYDSDGKFRRLWLQESLFD